MQSGVIGDVADDLIARENSLLRIETENISTDDSHTIAEVPIPKLQSETTSTKIISADSQLESSINSDSGSY